MVMWKNGMILGKNGIVIISGRPVVPRPNALLSYERYIEYMVQNGIIRAEAN